MPLLHDSSLRIYYYKGKLYTRRSYPVSNYDNTNGNTDLNNEQARLLNRYSLHRFIGFLGESSTSVVNTALFGDLTLNLRLRRPMF